jgi:hypothetical protein
MNFFSVIKLLAQTMFPNLTYSDLKLNNNFWASIQILCTISPLLIEIAAVSLPIVLGGSFYLYNEIVFLNNGRYSFALANNCSRMLIRGSENHVCHPMHHHLLSRIYWEFQQQHLENARANIEIPRYFDSAGREHLHYSTNTWAAYNIHRDMENVLTTGDAFNRWGSDFQTRGAAERYKVLTTNQIWRHRSEVDFERLDVSRFTLRRVINHTYTEQLREMKTTLYVNTFKNNPSACNYFKFGC